MTGKVALYSAVGDKLTRYEVDVEGAALARRETVPLLANAQYAWPHPSRRYLYIATSNRGSSEKADFNHISAFRIDPERGALTPHGEPAVHAQRAVHICVDPTGRFLVAAHNLPKPGITVNRINDDGTLGAQVKQPDTLELGIYPHQIMVTPSGRSIILVDRGNSAAADKPEDPGALRVFNFDDGVLSHKAVIAPNGGRGFGVRHLDFHPGKPWVYVSLEIQSQLYMYRMPGDNLEAEAAYKRDTLADRANVKRRQLAGGIHVHPHGHAVYVANRADLVVDYEGQRVFGGGENSIAAFAIDPATGEPTLMHHAETQSFHVRTFSFDPGGRLMVTASIKPLAMREGNTVKNVPAALSVFRVAPDGRLEFVRKYDVETAGKDHYWMGMVGLT